MVIKMLKFRYFQCHSLYLDLVWHYKADAFLVIFTIDNQTQVRLKDEGKRTFESGQENKFKFSYNRKIGIPVKVMFR